MRRLLIRPGAIGDLIVSLPALEFLRADYTDVDTSIGAPALDALNTVSLLNAINFSGYAPSGGAVYPNSGFGRGMRSAAALIKADVEGMEANVIAGARNTIARGSSMRETGRPSSERSGSDSAPTPAIQ